MKIICIINVAIPDLVTFPTIVEPVNDILDTRGCSHKTLPTWAALVRDDVITLKTPGGRPACSAN